MAARSIDQQSASSSTMAENAVRGVVAGLVGGSVFGVQMAIGGMLPMVAQMIGSQSPVIGFVLHMIISAFIGGVYGMVATRLPASWLVVIGAGIVNGIIWWVLGALVIMPIVLGMTEMVFQIGDMQWMSLIGHVIFGIITAAFLALMNRR